ncbi:hypothetical protein CYMTET_19794 [Cymbomonas tetramitiformis]|uniref:Importin N-terminal domain-containing protein n=1 Tax=Cymbomonas tetramitiformis TaxID=36881 RepID=A0AAE0G6L2_9CHLO|nr:hypothetical protein CYMTET_19794 [Cymbomonas tetramitiformis]
MAAPMTEADIAPLYECLGRALDPNPAVGKPAEEGLATLEARPGFCTCLAAIIANRSEAVHDVRWLACVYFKNTINRQWSSRHNWRSGTKTGLSAEEKAGLRVRVLQLIREDTQQIAIQVALLIAKIARFDYPREWPNLFGDLLGQLATADVLLNQRIYLVLHRVLKELSTKRLNHDQKAFAEVTSQLFTPLWSQWQADTQIMFQGIPAMLTPSASVDPAELMAVCERWRFCLKALCSLVCFGFGSDHKTLQDVPLVPQVLPALLGTLRTLLPSWVHVQDESHPLHAVICKGCLKLMKAILAINIHHPWSCRHPDVLPPLLEFTFNHVCRPWEAVGSSPEGPQFDALTIQCLILLQNVRTWMKEQAPEEDSFGQTQPGSPLMGAKRFDEVQRLTTLRHEVAPLLSACFSEERVLMLAQILVSQYFPLSASDLEEWASGPEEYYHEQDTLSWKDSRRPCAEQLFVLLVQNHREQMVACVRSWLEWISSTAGSVDPGTLRTREALYNALGLASFDMLEVIDFNTWFHGSLVPELSSADAARQPLRRRAAWVVGQFFSASSGSNVSKVTDEMRPQAYTLLIRLLEEDAVVQLAAVDALRALVDDWSFYEEGFKDHLAPCLQKLFSLMHTTYELDSHMQVLGLVSIIMDRMGDRIKPFTAGILQVMSTSWQQSEGQSQLRMLLVQVMHKMVVAMGVDCVAAYPMLLPLLEYCTDITQPEELNLMEDGLLLWHETLKQVPQADPRLLQLFTNLPAILERSFEHLQTCLFIVRSYIMLAGPPFLQQHGAAVAGLLLGLIGEVKERCMTMIPPVICLILQFFPTEGTALLQPAMHKLLVLIFAGQESDMVVASCTGVFARVLLHCGAPVLMQLAAASMADPAAMAVFPAECRADPSGLALLMCYLDVWLDKADSLCTTEARKLAALALCKLLATGAPQVLDRLLPILSMCVSVIFETETDGTTCPEGYSYWVTRSAGGEEEEEEGTGSGEGARSQQMHAHDPVNSLRVSAVLRETLHSVTAVPHFQAALAQVDPSVLQQLKQCMGEGALPAQLSTARPDGR